MANEMGQRLARKIQKHMQPNPWSKVSETKRKMFLGVARDVLLELRTPNQKMLQSAVDQRFGLTIWQAMIDAALKEFNDGE